MKVKVVKELYIESSVENKWTEKKVETRRWETGEGGIFPILRMSRNNGKWRRKESGDARKDGGFHIFLEGVEMGHPILRLSPVSGCSSWVTPY